MDRPIRRQIEVDALPHEVWAALVTPDRLGGWFGASVHLDLRPGGALTFRMLDGSARRGVVEVVEPPRRFAFRWRSVRLGPDGVQVGDVSRVEFVLEPEGGRTRVTVVESPGVLAPDTEMLTKA